MPLTLRIYTLAPLLLIQTTFAGSAEIPPGSPSPIHVATPPRPLRVTVTRDELAAKPISPMLYGNFIESGFGRQLDGMWAEMLFNRSFEEIPPFKDPVWGWLNRNPTRLDRRSLLAFRL